MKQKQIRKVRGNHTTPALDLRSPGGRVLRF